MNIFVNKKILHNKELSNATIATYIALRSIFDLNRALYYVSESMLCFELYGNNTYTRYIKEAITRGIKDLESQGVISIKETISKTEYIVDLTGLKINDDEYYVVLDSSEIYDIFSVPGKTDKFALLRYFAVMIGTVDYNSHLYIDNGSNAVSNFVGYMPMNYIAKLAGIPTSTAVKYNATLEEIDLIYVYRHKSYNEENGQIKSFTNHYGRKGYEQYIVQFAEEYETVKGKGKKIVAKSNANNNRSLTQKYNAFCAGANYSEEEVREIYSRIHERNKKNQRIIAGCQDHEAVKKAIANLKDEKVFEDYFNTVSAEPEPEIKEEKIMYEMKTVAYNPKREEKKIENKAPIGVLIQRTIDTCLSDNADISDEELQQVLASKYPAAVDLFQAEIDRTRKMLQWI